MQGTAGHQALHVLRPYHSLLLILFPPNFKTTPFGSAKRSTGLKLALGKIRVMNKRKRLNLTSFNSHFLSYNKIPRNGFKQDGQVASAHLKC